MHAFDRICLFIERLYTLYTHRSCGLSFIQCGWLVAEMNQHAYRTVVKHFIRLCANRLHCVDCTAQPTAMMHSGGFILIKSQFDAAACRNVIWATPNDVTSPTTYVRAADGCSSSCSGRAGLPPSDAAEKFECLMVDAWNYERIVR